MKHFSCGAVVPGCEATFEAETEEGLFAQIGEHAREAHGMDSVPPELVAQVQRNIEDR